MMKPSATHVIELQSGIGEPATISLTTGQELQPLSIGKKGMWRIDSERVLDVHAFVYFDGKALFLQSAEDGATASVDGYPVGKAWTELHAPCIIEIGAATLRYRDLSVPLPAPPPPPPPEPSYPPPPRPYRSDRSHNQTGPPPPSRAYPSDRSHNQTGPQPPRMRDGIIRTADMPVHQDSHAPLPQSAQQHHLQHMQHAQQMHGMQPPSYTHGSGSYSGGGTQGSAPYSVAPPYPSNRTYGSLTGPPEPDGGVPQYVAKYKELSAAKRILLILAPFCLVAAGYLVLFDTPSPKLPPQAPANAPLVPVPVQPPPQPPPQPVQAVAPAPPPPQTLIPPPPQTFAAPPFIPPPPQTFAPVPPPAPPPAPTVQLACPAGYVPYTVAYPDGRVPCVLIGTPMPPPAPVPAPQPMQLAPVPAAPPTGLPVAPPPVDPSQLVPTRTLERQAVDFVAVNDYAHAAAVYEQLQQQNPSNRVYAEAARILRAKADATAR